MAKLHIVGIGGTGHKVLQAAIHLAACGAFKGKVGPNEISEVRVMSIDADDSNGNLNLTKKTLEAYQAFHSAISGSKFCPVEIDKPLDLRLYDGEKNSIEKAFGTAKFDEKNEKALLHVLYTEAEVKAQFNEGFYGHTSIGTLIVENMLNEKNKQWNDFVSNIDENDFVVIAGSIFGGTGASAIPVVLEKLNAKKEENSFYLAAIILTPYFKAFGKINERGGSPAGFKQISGKSKGWAVLLPKGRAL